MASYTLAEGEQLVMELTVTNVSRLESASNPLNFVQNLFKKSMPCVDKTAAVIAFTNMRVIITNTDKCCDCGRGHKFMWSYPRYELTGINGFEKIAGQYSCCDAYTVSFGVADSTITFETDDVRTVEQAQSVLMALHSLYIPKKQA